jgi:uncharacterized cupin superfamily protein
MATILKSTDRDFQENPGKTDPYKIFSDISGRKKGLSPQNLNFDIRRLDPGRFSAPYHFHVYAEELFLIMSGSATLRTPDGTEIVNSGDLMFFEKGETGAHQLYNHTDEPCVFLDIRTYLGYDLCEYPDSNKILIAPSMEVFDKNAQVSYFSGEENPKGKWNEIKEK